MKFMKFIFAGLALSWMSASLAVGFFDNQPTPQQSLHSSAPAATSDKNDNQAQMAKVLAIMAKAKSMENEKTKTAAEDAPQANPDVSQPVAPTAESSTAPSSSVNSEAGNTTPEIASINTQLNTLNQINLQFQQRVDQRLEMLSGKNVLLEQHIQDLVKALTMLNQEVTKLMRAAGNGADINAMPSAITHNANAVQHASWYKNITTQVGIMYFYITLAAAVLLLLFIVILMRKLCRQRRLLINNSGLKLVDGDSDTESEYDFINSEEAIPAKLDLARAYLAMDDTTSAKKVLTQVLKHGSEEQKQAAEELLKQASKDQ